MDILIAAMVGIDAAWAATTLGLMLLERAGVIMDENAPYENEVR